MMMDTYKIRKLKNEYVFIHDYIEQNMSLLNDLTARCLFRSLMAVASLDDISKWREAYEKTFPLVRDPKESLSPDAYDLLASFKRKLVEMSNEELEVAVKEIVSLKTKNFAVDFKMDVLLLEKETASLQRIHPEHILIFKDMIGEQIAFGRNAERLFEVFGWQTATIEVDGRKITAMPIHPKDSMFLDKLKVLVSDTKANIGNIGYVDEMEYEMSYAQQTIDCFRQELGDRKYVLNTGGLVYHYVNKGINERIEFPFIYISREKIDLYRLNASSYILVEGKSWNVSRENFMVVADTAAFFNFLSDNRDKEDWENVLSEEYQKREREKADILFHEYMETKQNHQDEIVLMVNKRLATSFGKDAVRLAKALKIGLWFRSFNHINNVIVPMILITSDMSESLSKDIRRLNVFRAKEREGVNIHMITCVPSFLNEGLMADVPFAQAAVFKMKDGGYGVRARLEGIELPVVRIHENMALFYLSQEEGIVKETCLNAILMRAYYCSKVISRKCFST